MDNSSNVSLLERVYKWEKERGDSLVFTQPMGGGEVKTYSWAQALDEARRMAAYLRSLALEPGSQIAIISKNCVEFMLSDLAIWMAGHCSVALYPTLNQDTVRYTLEHSESKLVFIGKLDDAPWKEMEPGIPEGMPRISYPLSPVNDATFDGQYTRWNAIIRDNAPITDSPVRGPEERAMLVYTSGSTGQPKGVEHNFGSMAIAAGGFNGLFDFSGSDRLLSYLPLAHVFERAAVEVSCFYNGLQVFFAESLDTFVQDLQRARPTIFHSVPRLWLKFQLGVFAKMPPEKLARLLRIPLLSWVVRRKVLKGLGLDAARIAISGSAPIPPDLVAWYQNLGLELLEGYAMSENFAYSHISRIQQSRVGYVGHPCPGVEVRISPEGEILVKSPSNMVGYFKQPELTADSFTEDGYLKTGDRGEEDEEKRLKITGRVKELFKTSKGKYVAPAPIENLINANGNVETSCVAGAGYDKPHAVLMLSEALRAKIDQSDVRRQVEQQLQDLLKTVNKKVEAFEQLAFLAVVKDEWQIENGYLTPTMKIKRDVVESAYSEQLDGWYETRAPVVWEG